MTAMTLKRLSVGGRNLGGVAVIVLASMVFASAAYAGADATFTPLVTKLTGWLNGSLGYLIAIGAFLVGLVNAVRGERGFWPMLFPFLLSIIITVGLTIIAGGFTATV